MKERREASRNTLLVLPVLLVLVLSGCGEATTTLVPAAVTTSAVSSVTTAAITTSAVSSVTTAAVTTSAVSSVTTAAVTTSTTATKPAIAPTTTGTAIATALSPVPEVRHINPATGTLISSLGKELEGQLIAVGNDPKEVVCADVRVVKVAAYESFTYINTPYKPKNGAFLLVLYETANLGKAPLGGSSGFGLFNGSDKRVDFASAAPPIDKLPDLTLAYNRSAINPGFVARSLVIYDVPKDVADLKLKADNSTSRKPSLESFKLSGGKGPDSQAGSDLVGKTGKDLINQKVSYKVTQAERLSEVKANDGVLEKPEGVFLVVVFEVDNQSTGVLSSLSQRLYDSEGQNYSVTDNQYVTQALQKKYNADTFTGIAAGQKGTRILVFEVLKEAKGFELR
ncbi:MAG: hypothetical protein HXX20_10030 [Chloroflexi bacterium]|nr:hypothetical protein [Chloroflexota bacterium]